MRAPPGWGAVSSAPISAPHQEQMAAAKAREEQRRIEMEQQKARAENEAGTEGGVADRIDNLEKRMRRMEAALDAILQKLEKMEGGR